MFWHRQYGYEDRSGRSCSIFVLVSNGIRGNMRSWFYLIQKMDMPCFFFFFEIETWQTVQIFSTKGSAEGLHFSDGYSLKLCISLIRHFEHFWRWSVFFYFQENIAHLPSIHYWYSFGRIGCKKLRLHH